jgi:hypothetical protein
LGDVRRPTRGPILLGSVPPRPTNLAALPRLLSYAQGLRLEQHLVRAKRGMATLALAVVWLVLAWRGPAAPTGRPVG